MRRCWFTFLSGFSAEFSTAKTQQVLLSKDYGTCTTLSRTSSSDHVNFTLTLYIWRTSLWLPSAWKTSIDKEALAITEQLAPRASEPSTITFSLKKNSLFRRSNGALRTQSYCRSDSSSSISVLSTSSTLQLDVTNINRLAGGISWLPESAGRSHEERVSEQTRPCNTNDLKKDWACTDTTVGPVTKKRPILSASTIFSSCKSYWTGLFIGANWTLCQRRLYQ